MREDASKLKDKAGGRTGGGLERTVRGCGLRGGEVERRGERGQK